MTDYGISKDISSVDPRQELWTKQREERGFDDTELWNLDHTITRFILPRLTVFMERASGYPGAVGSEEAWNTILKSMVAAFTLIAEDKISCTAEEQEVISTGLSNFCRYFQTLWE